MSTADVFEHFIKPLGNAFSAPPGNDPEGFFSLLADDLSGFSVHQLREAAASIRKTRAARGFPTVAECLQACNAQSRDEVHDRRQVSADEAASRRRSDAYRIMCTDMALCHEAQKGGWLGGLLDYVEAHGCMPAPVEHTRLSAKSRNVRAELERIEGPMGLKLMDAYRQRYRTIQAAIFGQREAA